MKYDKKSIDYQLNIYNLQEMERVVPMTSLERKCIWGWVKKGHEVESNPWNYKDAYECPLNFLQAYRITYGYSSGPWELWRGLETQGLWDDDLKCFRHHNDT